MPSSSYVNQDMLRDILGSAYEDSILSYKPGASLLGGMKIVADPNVPKDQAFALPSGELVMTPEQIAKVTAKIENLEREIIAGSKAKRLTATEVREEQERAMRAIQPLNVYLRKSPTIRIEPEYDDFMDMSGDLHSTHRRTTTTLELECTVMDGSMIEHDFLNAGQLVILSPEQYAQVASYGRPGAPVSDRQVEHLRTELEHARSAAADAESARVYAEQARMREEDRVRELECKLEEKQREIEELEKREPRIYEAVF